VSTDIVEKIQMPKFFN